jgi:hypothetical protein
MADHSEQITELPQLLVSTEQQQLNISRSLMAAQSAHAESLEASLKLNRRLVFAMTVLLVIVGVYSPHFTSQITTTPALSG